jgi:putative transposase
MPNSYVYLLYHIIFSTKRRRPWIKEDYTDRLYAYLGGAVKGEGGDPVKTGGVEDHLHMLANLRQDVAVSEAIKRIKSGSSQWIHENLPGMSKFAWQAGYAAFTVSRSNRDSVSEYIARQKEHHKRKTFQEELAELFALHGIEPDPRFFER